MLPNLGMQKDATGPMYIHDILPLGTVLVPRKLLEDAKALAASLNGDNQPSKIWAARVEGALAAALSAAALTPPPEQDQKQVDDAG